MTVKLTDIDFKRYQVEGANYVNDQDYSLGNVDILDLDEFASFLRKSLFIVKPEGSNRDDRSQWRLSFNGIGNDPKRLNYLLQETKPWALRLAKQWQGIKTILTPVEGLARIMTFDLVRVLNPIYKTNLSCISLDQSGNLLPQLTESSFWTIKNQTLDSFIQDKRGVKAFLVLDQVKDGSEFEAVETIVKEFDIRICGVLIFASLWSGSEKRAKGLVKKDFFDKQTVKILLHFPWRN